MDSISQEFIIIIFSSLFIVIVIVAIINLVLIYQKKKIKFLQEKENIKILHKNELLQTQLEIQEQTLTNISQEIHDNIGQILSLAKLHLNTMDTIIDEQQQLKITDTKNLVSKAIIDLRNLSRSMYGHHLQDIGLQQAIIDELHILKNTGVYVTNIATFGEAYKLPNQTEIVLFRIVQEAINNSIKHAKASNINIEIVYSITYLSIVITDDGQGFNNIQQQICKDGLGLQNMQNRAILIGATCTIASTINKGTTININLPITN